jgi:diguanylate cyclase (GGDEF)-like protein
MGLPASLASHLRDGSERALGDGCAVRFLARNESQASDVEGYAGEITPLALGSGQGVILNLRPVLPTREVDHGHELTEAVLASPVFAAAAVRLPDWVCWTASRGLEQLLHMQPGQLNGGSLLPLFERPGDPPRIAREIALHEPLQNMESTLVSPEGYRVHALISGNRVEFCGTPSLLLLFTGCDEHHRLQEMTGYDPLTGLPNRNHLADRLRGAMARASRRSEIVAVLFLDLDGFKQVNDRHGHQVGDQLLATAAQRLSGAVRGYDTIARLGGDEFVAVLERLQQPEQANNVAEHLQGVLAEPVQLGDCRISLRISIGIALYPFDGESVEGLVQQADAAMYRAKAAGGGFIVTADPAETVVIPDLTGRS